MSKWGVLTMAIGTVVLVGYELADVHSLPLLLFGYGLIVAGIVMFLVKKI